MAYDEGLAERIRQHLGGDPDVAEKRMFGGIAFLLHGNMAVGVMSGGELMVRVGPDATDDALARPHTRRFDMTGRPMKGWILVSPDRTSDEAGLSEWVDAGADFAASLPPK